MEHMGEPALAPLVAGRNFVADKAEVRRAVEAFLDSTFNKQPGGEVARATRSEGLRIAGGRSWRSLRDGFSATMRLR